MAYTYRSSGTAVYVGSGGNIDLSGSAPSGVTTGDLLLLFTGQRGTTTGAPSLTAGWTLLETNGYGSAGSAEIYARIADGTAADAPSTVDWPGSAGCVAWIERWDGGGYTDLATIVAHSASGSGTATSLQLPAFTPATVDNCLVVGFSVKNNTATDATTISHSTLTKRTQYVAPVASRVHAASGSLQQTTAADYAGSDFTVDGTSESLSSRGVLVYLRTADAAAAGWTATPLVSSQTSTAYTVGFTASVASTAWGVAVIAGSAAPSIAQVKAGQNGAGGTAKASATKSVTTSPDTLVLTPSDSPAFPRYDLYFVLNSGGGDSTLEVLVSEFLDPPAGKIFATLSSVDATSPFYGTGAAAADTCVLASTTSPDAYTVACEVDGTVTYNSAGDDSRQLVSADVYDYSAAAYLGAGTLVFNNLAPDSGGVAFNEPLLYRKSVAITAVDLLDYAPDPEADTVVATALDALPTGLSITSSSLSGTPTVYGQTLTQLRWTDQYGSTYTEAVTFQIGDLVPDVVGDAQATAVSAIEAVASMTAALTFEYNVAAAGTVISQDPAAALAPHDQIVTLLISWGELSGSGEGGQYRANRRSGCARGLLRIGGRG